MNIKEDMWNKVKEGYKEQNYECSEEYCECEDEDYEYGKMECECEEKYSEHEDEKCEYEEKNYKCKEKNDKYEEEDEIAGKSIKYKDKDMEKHFSSDESKMHLNCKLKVDFGTENKMIYLCPGKLQYFTVDVLKSCGDVTIKYKGCYSSNGIRGNLGIYKIVKSGIIVKTYCKLDPRKSDFLTFTAIDKCTNECYDFVVAFSFNPCRCC